MCEHNLVIGQVRVTEGECHCAECDEVFTPTPRNCHYIGDFLPSVHRFKLHDYITCPKCGNKIYEVDYFCGQDTPIDVTQEFLSLPVRSRE